MENNLIFTTKIKTVTTKFTTKKQRKQENSLENLGNTNLIDTSVYNGLMLNSGIIWNRIEYYCGGGRGIRTLGTLPCTAH